VSEHGLDVDEGRKPENSNKNRSMSVLPPSTPSATGIYCHIYLDNAQSIHSIPILTQFPPNLYAL